MLAPIELLGPVVYYLFKRYQVGSENKIEDDVEKAKAEAREAQGGKEDYAKKEAEEKKDKIANVLKNNSFLLTVGIGLAMGLVEGFWHGPLSHV